MPGCVTGALAATGGAIVKDCCELRHVAVIARPVFSCIMCHVPVSLGLLVVSPHEKHAAFSTFFPPFSSRKITAERGASTFCGCAPPQNATANLPLCTTAVKPRHKPRNSQTCVTVFRSFSTIGWPEEFRNTICVSQGFVCLHRTPNEMLFLSII